jgi:hypothetical protein
MRAFSDVPKALSLAACLATCLALAACAGTQPIPYSGIASSTQLRPSQHDDSGRIPFEYKTQVDWRRYSGFVLDPVAIYRGSDGQFDDISEDDKAFLARSMRDQFTEKLNARFRNPPGRSADAVRIKLTLTGAKTNTAVLSTFSRFDLMGGPYNAVQAVRGREGAMTGSVSFAVEIYDASTNALLGAYVAKQYPNAWNLKAGIGARSASVVGIEKGADQLVAYLQ